MPLLPFHLLLSVLFAEIDEVDGWSILETVLRLCQLGYDISLIKLLVLTIRVLDFLIVFGLI